MNNLRQSIEDAKEAIGVLQATTSTTAKMFRSGDIVAGNESLAVIARALRLMLQLITIISLIRLKVDDYADVVNALNKQLEALLAAQSSEDWIAVADVIEYDIGPGLEQWQKVLDAPVAPAM